MKKKNGEIKKSREFVKHGHIKTYLSGVSLK